MPISICTRWHSVYRSRSRCRTCQWSSTGKCQIFSGLIASEEDVSAGWRVPAGIGASGRTAAVDPRPASRTSGGCRPHSDPARSAPGGGNRDLIRPRRRARPTRSRRGALPAFLILGQAERRYPPIVHEHSGNAAGRAGASKDIQAKAKKIRMRPESRTGRSTNRFPLWIKKDTLSPIRCRD